MNIVSSELILYGDKQISLSLSENQLYVLLKVLGIKFNDEGYSCFTDEFLNELINKPEFKNKNIINKDWVLSN